MIYLFTILLALFQATLVNLIAVGNIKPDLLLVLVIFVALYKGIADAAICGILAGFLKDVFSTGAFLNIFILPVCGVAVGLFIIKFYLYKENLLVQSLIVLAASIFLSAAYLAWFSGWDYTPPIFILAARIGIPTVIYNVLISVPAFSVFKKIFNVVPETPI